MGVAIAVPAAAGWDVHVRGYAPLLAEWNPRAGAATAAAVALAFLAARFAVDLAERLPWRALLAAAFAGGLAWMLALALLDGTQGLGHVLETPYEYLRTARRVGDSTCSWRSTSAGSPTRRPRSPTGRCTSPAIPPGALLFFVGLDRIGLGGGLAAGLVITVLAATTAMAVLITLRVLGEEAMARRAAPVVVFGPAAVWQAVSADAMFAAVAAWGLAALALATTRRSAAWAVVGGLLLGCCAMLSYGLLLLAIPALTVIALGGWWRALPAAAAAALAVVLAFAALGFSYLEALPVLRERYLDGVGGRRPASYWLWGGFAALAISAGPLAGAGPRPAAEPRSRPVGAGGRRARGRRRRLGARGRGHADEQGRGRADLAAVRAVAPTRLRAAARALAPPRARAPARGRARRPASAEDRLVGRAAAARLSRACGRLAGASAR